MQIGCRYQFFALNSKKEDVAAAAASVQYGLTPSTIKITIFHEMVKNVSSNDVADILGYDKGKLHAEVFSGHLKEIILDGCDKKVYSV